MNRTARLRDALGAPSERATTKVKDHMVPFVQNFIARAPFAVLATSNADGDCDASPKGGQPGFVKVVDERTLLIPDLGGNRLFQSYDNVSGNAKAAMLFMIPGQEITVRVNGRVRVIESAAVEALGVTPQVQWSDRNTVLVQGLLLSVDESYFHCARSIKFSDLWNTQTIETNRGMKLKDNPMEPPSSASS